MTVVLAGGDYPARGDVGSPITGIEAAEATGALVFHAGTALHDGAVVTNGGRILNVTAAGDDIASARAAAYAAADLITWDGRAAARGHRARGEPRSAPGDARGSNSASVVEVGRRPAARLLPSHALE